MKQTQLPYPEGPRCGAESLVPRRCCSYIHLCSHVSQGFYSELHTVGPGTEYSLVVGTLILVTYLLKVRLPHVVSQNGRIAVMYSELHNKHARATEAEQEMHISNSIVGILWTGKTKVVVLSTL